MNNISNGGFQYNCRYLNRNILPCRDINDKSINPVLVRSREAQDKQNQYKQVVNLEKQVNNLQTKLEIALSDIIPLITNKCPCLKPMDTKILVKSKAAFDFSNLCNRVSTLYKRVDQMAELLNAATEVSDINVHFRFQKGVKRYPFCVKLSLLQRRINLLNNVINNL